MRKMLHQPGGYPADTVGSLPDCKQTEAVLKRIHRPVLRVVYRARFALSAYPAETQRFHQTVPSAKKSQMLRPQSKTYNVRHVSNRTCHCVPGRWNFFWCTSDWILLYESRMREQYRTQTVREWFDSFGIPLDDSFFIEWATFQKNFVTLIGDAERFLDEAAMRQVWNPIFGILYLCYDLEREFLPQFRENAEKLLRGLQMTADTKTT